MYHLKSSYNVLGQNVQIQMQISICYTCISKFNNNKNKYSNKSLNNDNIHVNFFFELKKRGSEDPVSLT